ncbi:hypothetical protein DCAR_0311154 [Daucus carota subsp. sativus]|uniref:Uncharacterized protein n=1 Tax=Daucus carota subsp. sativus TaxID=79200 RepID=A0AAF0WMM6_DAUCS|nr:hypothetical protein DCAR_0311154 [Daucus carota subsp. sativus]
MLTSPFCKIWTRVLDHVTLSNPFYSPNSTLSSAMSSFGNRTKRNSLRSTGAFLFLCCAEWSELCRNNCYVLTSIPFVVLGYKAPRKNQNCKLYAHSLIGVGVALSLYFKRKIKKTFEMADYATIVAATVVHIFWLSGMKNPKLLMAASALVLPIQPLKVSTVAFVYLFQVAFAKRALKDPKLKMAYNVHKMLSLLANDAFLQTPFMLTCNKLLE